MPETYEQFLARVKANAFIPHSGDIPMPKQVKLAKGREFEFKAASKGGESKYDWAAWLNGDLLLIEQSEGDKDEKGNVTTVKVKKDYEADTNQMPGKLKMAARRRYKVVQISRLDAQGHKLKESLIIKARDMDATERIAEDALRAEEKVALAAKKKAAKDADANTTPPATDTASQPADPAAA